MNIKLTDKDKIKINDSTDVYAIMQKILLRENKIDREKEHFWVIGMNQALVILYIELVSMGSVRATLVEPMNVYRVAVQKGAIRVIAAHNHPAYSMKPSDDDKDITDRLIQVGKILGINMDDHMIISPNTYMSFRNIGLMEELEKSIKYVPSYQLVQKIRKEEQKIREEAVRAERLLRKEAEYKKKEAEKREKGEIRIRKEAEKREKEEIRIRKEAEKREKEAEKREKEAEKREKEAVIDKLMAEKGMLEAEKDKLEAEKKLLTVVNSLMEKQMTVDQIAEILNLTTDEIGQLFKAT